MADAEIEIDTDEDAIVEITPEELDTSEGEVSGEPKAAEPAEDIDPVAELKQRLEDEKRAKVEAVAAAKASEERAARFEREASDNRGQAVNSQVHQFSSAIEAVGQHVANTKREYAEALASGDYVKVADLQEKIADQVHDLKTLKQHKAQLEYQQRQPPQQQRQPQPQPRPSGDPVDAIVANLMAQGTPRAAAWVKAHPELVRDQKSLDRIADAHKAATEDGNLQESNRYFAFIEDYLGLTTKDPEPAAAPRRAPVAAAPVSRQAPSMNGSRAAEKVRLTPYQVQYAKEIGISLQDMAKSVLQGRQLERDGITLA